MAKDDGQITSDSTDDDIRRAILAVLDDARLGSPADRPDIAILQRRFAWRYLPDIVAPLLRRAIGLAGTEPAAALAMLEAENVTDQNLEIPLLAAALARATGAASRTRDTLAQERFVTLFQSARQLVDKGYPHYALSLLLRQAPLVHLMFLDPVQRLLATARFLSLMGSALDDMSRFHLSEQAYLACLELIDGDAVDFNVERAKTLSNLGALYQLDGQFEKSSQVLDRAVAAFEILPTSELTTYGLATALINRGHSADYRGRPADAEADWRRAFALAAGVNTYHDATAAEAAMHLAGQQFDRENWPAALTAVRLGWQAALRAGDVARQGEIIALAAQGALRAHQDTRAVRLYGLARSRFEALAPDHLADYLDALRGQAQALGYCGDFADAMTAANHALSEGTAALGELHEQNLRTKALLADLCWDVDAFGEGRVWAGQARDDARAIFPPDHPTNLNRESRLAEFLLMDGESREAIEILLDCLAREPLLTDRLIDRHSDLVDLGAMRTAGSQLDLATLAVLRAEPADPDVIMRLVESRLRFGGSGIALLAARRSGRRLPSDLARTLLADADAVPLIATTTLFQEHGVVRRALALWSGANCTLHDLGPSAAMDAALARWSRAPWRPVDEAVWPLLDHLHEHAGSAQTLLWFPDNALATTPIATLFSAKHPQLLDRFAIIQSRDAYASFGLGASAKGGVLLVGVSEFHGEDGGSIEQPLPSVRDEIAGVASIYRDVTRLVDAEATIAGLADALARRPAVVHIATHGLIEMAGEGRSRMRRALQRLAVDDPLQRCAIVLAGASDDDRLLTARAMAGWDLGSVRLCVLAACDSGVGLNDAAEGSLGFQAALHHAGVDTILSSLWPIGDRESALVMAKFHEGIACGLRPSTALRAAQRAAAHRGDNPATWGGFVVSGADDPVEIARSGEDVPGA